MLRQRRVCPVLIQEANRHISSGRDLDVPAQSLYGSQHTIVVYFLSRCPTSAWQRRGRQTDQFWAGLAGQLLSALAGCGSHSAAVHHFVKSLLAKLRGWTVQSFVFLCKPLQWHGHGISAHGKSRGRWPIAAPVPQPSIRLGV